MGKPIQNHGIKYLATASFVVFVWFIWRLGLNHEAQEKIDAMAMSAAKAKSPHGNNNGEHVDILDEAAAAQYCSNFRLKPFPRDRVKKRKIFDLLLVNTELEMLEVRMGQMNPGVDYFVVIESDKTFTDKPKPLHVQENWAMFAPYHDQMIRRTMDLTKGDFNTTWDRERASRNAMYKQVIPFLKGEQEAHMDDVLLVSDVDEMFKPETLKVFRNCEIPDKVTAQSGLFYYSFQWLCEANWPHPQATIYKGKNTTLPQDLRNHGDGHLTLQQSAWHCSYCFPEISEFVGKITSFSHTELDQDDFKDPAKILERVRNGHDLFERHLCTRIENNPDVPGFVKANTDRFGYMLDRDPENGNFRDYTPPRYPPEGEKSEQKSEQKTEGKAEEKTKEKTEGETEEKTEEKSEEKTEGASESQS